MARSDNDASSKSKNSLPQTPKNLKIEPNRIQEEFSRELDLNENVKIRATRPK